VAPALPPVVVVPPVPTTPPLAPPLVTTPPDLPAPPEIVTPPPDEPPPPVTPPEPGAPPLEPPATAESLPRLPTLLSVVGQPALVTRIGSKRKQKDRFMMISQVFLVAIILVSSVSKKLHPSAKIRD
jgi:hypothetical protein